MPLRRRRWRCCGSCWTASPSARWGDTHQPQVFRNRVLETVVMPQAQSAAVVDRDVVGILVQRTVSPGSRICCTSGQHDRNSSRDHCSGSDRGLPPAFTLQAAIPQTVPRHVRSSQRASAAPDFGKTKFEIGAADSVAARADTLTRHPSSSPGQRMQNSESSRHQRCETRCRVGWSRVRRRSRSLGSLSGAAWRCGSRLRRRT